VSCDCISAASVLFWHSHPHKTQALYTASKICTMHSDTATCLYTQKFAFIRQYKPNLT
jgi:hypothetical protein